MQCHNDVIIPTTLSNLRKLDVCRYSNVGLVNIQNCINLEIFCASLDGFDGFGLIVVGLSSCHHLKELKLSAVTIKDGLHPLTRLEKLKVCGKVDEMLFYNEENFENCVIEIMSYLHPYHDKLHLLKNLPRSLWSKVIRLCGPVSNFNLLPKLDTYHHDVAGPHSKWLDFSTSTCLTTLTVENASCGFVGSCDWNPNAPNPNPNIIIPPLVPCLQFIKLSGVDLSTVLSLLKASPFVKSLDISCCKVNSCSHFFFPTHLPNTNDVPSTGTCTSSCCCSDPSQLSLRYLKDLTLWNCPIFSHLPPLPRLLELSVRDVSDFDISRIGEFPLLSSLYVFRSPVSLTNLKPHHSLEVFELLNCPDGAQFKDNVRMSYLFPCVKEPKVETSVQCTTKFSFKTFPPNFSLGSPPLFN
ncbi:hypothetical protein RCL1_007592 [Eukaryota sp. TZLM3-RCL]